MISLIPALKLHRVRLFRSFLPVEYVVICYYQLEKEGMEVSKVYIGIATEDVIPEWLELAREVEPVFQGSMVENEEFHTFMRSKIDKSEVIIARDSDHQGLLMGLITISHKNSRISWFAVFEKYRGMGVGSKLLEYAINELDSKNEILVTTFREEYEVGKPARHVYQKFGFVDYDTSVFHHGQPRSLMRRLPQKKEIGNISVREATTNDLPKIKELYWVLDTDAIYYQPEHFIRTDRPNEFLLSIINNEKSDFLLAEVHNKVIGFSLVQERETGNLSCLKKEHYAYILDFVIAEEYRSKGYGTYLLQASKQWARNRKLGFLRLSVFPQNHKGIEFYKKQGLKTTMQTMECTL